MDISTLKGTDNKQFEKTATVDITHPVTGEVFYAKVKSVNNPDIKDDLADLHDEYNKEQAKLENGKLSKEQKKDVRARVEKLGTQIAHFVCTGFEGLKNGKKDVECTPELKKDLIENYVWISKQIVENATNHIVFYGLESNNS